MPARWEVLASGSKGNVNLLEVNGGGLLLDAGLPARRVAGLLAEVGFHWKQVQALLLTHTHSDHWDAGVLDELLRWRIPLYCHARHRRTLQSNGPAFVPLAQQGLVRYFESGRRMGPLPGVTCTPLAIPHDGGATFGFRFEGSHGAGRAGWALGYAADLGSWERHLPAALANVDVLGLEFNHDLDLQLASRRPRWLVNRILGDRGHLSNHQGARLLKKVLHLSTPNRLRHVVQLHLSDDCNRTELAAGAAQSILNELGAAAQVHTTRQGIRGPTIEL